MIGDLKKQPGSCISCRHWLLLERDKDKFEKGELAWGRCSVLNRMHDGTMIETPGVFGCTEYKEKHDE